MEPGGIARPEPPRPTRGGSSSWARRFNDNTPELVAAVARITALVGVFALVGVLLAAAWVHGPGDAARFAVIAFVLSNLTFWSAWLGFVKLANPDWPEWRWGRRRG